MESAYVDYLGWASVAECVIFYENRIALQYISWDGLPLVLF